MSESQVLSRSDKYKSLVTLILESKCALVELTLQDGSYICTPSTHAKLAVFNIGNGWTVTLPLSGDAWSRNLEFKCVTLEGKCTLYAEVMEDGVRFYYRK